jgi:hypothetical protein
MERGKLIHKLWKAASKVYMLREELAKADLLKEDLAIVADKNGDNGDNVLATVLWERQSVSVGPCYHDSPRLLGSPCTVPGMSYRRRHAATMSKGRNCATAVPHRN